jgi:hypothetical protein
MYYMKIVDKRARRLWERLVRTYTSGKVDDLHWAFVGLVSMAQSRVSQVFGYPVRFNGMEIGEEPTEDQWSEVEQLLGMVAMDAAMAVVRRIVGSSARGLKRANVSEADVHRFRLLRDGMNLGFDHLYDVDEKYRVWHLYKEHLIWMVWIPESSCFLIAQTWDNGDSEHLVDVSTGDCDFPTLVRPDDCRWEKGDGFRSRLV